MRSNPKNNWLFLLGALLTLPFLCAITRAADEVQLPLEHYKALAGNVADEKEMVDWIEKQVSFGERHPGSPAEKANEQYLFNTLSKFPGVTNVHLEPVRDPLELEVTPQTKGKVAPGHQADPLKPISFWNVNETLSEFRVFDKVGGRKVDAYPVAHTPFLNTKDCVMTYADRENHVYDPDAVISAWANKIVVARITYPPIPTGMFLMLANFFGVYDDPAHPLANMNHGATWVREGWELYDIAARSGAAGFVGILADQPGGDYRNYGPYGFKERDMLNKTLPAVWVSKREEATLIDDAKRGVSAYINNVGTVSRTEGNNVVAEIPGKTPGAEAIILSSHTDSPFLSPVEDASGVASVLAIAKKLGSDYANGVQLERRVIIVLTAGHFYGSVGTRSFIMDHPRLINPENTGVKKAVLEISIEHVAMEGVENPKTHELETTGQPEPTAIFLSHNFHLRDAVWNAIHKYGLSRTVLLPASGALGDYPPTDGGDWFTAGVPTINHIANPVNLLTDSQDKRDPKTGRFRWLAYDRLTRVAATYWDVIWTLDKVPQKELFHDMSQKGWMTRWIKETWSDRWIRAGWLANHGAKAFEDSKRWFLFQWGVAKAALGYGEMN